MPFGRSGQGVAAALVATIAVCRAAPLGSWSATYGAGCPAEFPFRSRSPDPALRKNICYEHEWQAAAGTGPCGSWCTMDVTVGSGCGNNAGRLCGSGCPADFPFWSRSSDPALRENICYQHEWQAAAGTGPCGSWCTMDVTVGSGCGDNSGRRCGAGPSYNPDRTASNGGAPAAELASATALSHKLATANTAFGECDSTIQTVATYATELEGDLLDVKYVVVTVSNVNDQIGIFLSRLRAIGLTTALGSIPVYGTAIKAGIRIGETVSKAMDRVFGTLKTLSKKVVKAVGVTEDALTGLADKTDKTAAALNAGSVLQKSALQCASDNPADHHGNQKFEAASSKVLAHESSQAIDLVATAGTQCNDQLATFERTLNVVKQLAASVARMAEPLMKILRTVEILMDLAEYVVDKFMQSDAMQCGLALTEGLRDLASLVMCPIDEVTRVWEFYLDLLLAEVVEFMDDMAREMVESVVDLVVPDKLNFKTPNFLGALPKIPGQPGQLWQCTLQKAGAELGVTDHALDFFEVSGYIRSMTAMASREYRITGDEIKDSIMEALGVGAQFDSSVETTKYESACADAWNEMKSSDADFQSCVELVKPLSKGLRGLMPNTN